jgi:hypothetical protein
MTFLAERLRVRSNTFFNEINFVTKEYDKILVEYNKPEKYGGLADNRQNYGYIRLLFNKVEYQEERRDKFARGNDACFIDSYPNAQFSRGLAKTNIIINIKRRRKFI